MAKQHRKGSGRGKEQVSSAETATERSSAPELAEQQSVGNQAALQGAELTGGLLSDAGSELGADLVRDAAFSLVGRGVLALQLFPTPTGQLERFLDIIERSHLPGDRKEALTERLHADKQAGDIVQSAVSELVGQDGPEARAQLNQELESIWTELQQGELSATSWTQAGGTEIALSEQAATGPVEGRAPALVADIARSLGITVAASHSDAGAAVQAFCSAVHLALIFDEEEEEDFTDDGVEYE